MNAVHSIRDAARAPRRSPLTVIAAVLSFAMLAAACDTPTASRPSFAFDPTALSDGKLYRWTKGRTIRVWADLTDSSRTLNLGRSVRVAMSNWNALPAFGEYKLELVTNPAEANILVFNRNRPLPIVAGACPFTPREMVGYTYFCASGRTADRLQLANGQNGQASVVIRVDDNLVTTQSGLDNIMAHEFGHALGIGAHSDSASDLMFGLPTIAFPTGRDAQTLQYVLGSPADIIL